jgi:hypothetical protein
VTTRRGFLGSILALGVAPAIVRADSLMRIVPREVEILTSTDGVTWGAGNSLMTIDEITRRSLAVLERNMAQFAHNVNREYNAEDWYYANGKHIIVRRL